LQTIKIKINRPTILHGGIGVSKIKCIFGSVIPRIINVIKMNIKDISALYELLEKSCFAGSLKTRDLYGYSKILSIIVRSNMNEDNEPVTWPKI
jgi:hypothetical protein